MQYQNGYNLDQELVENLKKRDWLVQNATEIIKDKVNVIVKLPIPLNRQIYDLVLKSFGWRDWFSRLLSPVSRSKAEKSYDVSVDLMNMGISVPKPISVYTFRKSRRIKENFFISENVSNSISANDMMKSNDFDFETKKQLVKKIAKLTRILHKNNRLHNDLTKNNILVQNYEDFENMQLTLIDLNRVSKHFILTRHQRMWDIVKLRLCSCGMSSHENCFWNIFFEHYNIGNTRRNKLFLHPMLLGRKRVKKTIKTIKGKNKV